LLLGLGKKILVKFEIKDWFNIFASFYPKMKKTY
jgi:hypothetical protein